MSFHNNDQREDQGTQKTYMEREYESLIEKLESVFDFQQWKFQNRYTRVSENALPYVIYSSEWCKVMFALKGGDMHRPNEMSVYYGRLHAPDDDGPFLLDGEEYRTWHRVNEALYFLDGLSRKEASEKRQVRYEFPDLIQQFRNSELGQKVLPGGYQTVVGVARLHLSIWEHYGLRLFELFDLRRPDLWDQFVPFISDFHMSLPNVRGFPAPDKNC
jgi:hypothetical protein